MKTFNTQFNIIGDVSVYLGVIINEYKSKVEEIQLNILIEPTPSRVIPRLIYVDNENFDSIDIINNIIVYIQREYFFEHNKYLTDENMIRIKDYLIDFFSKWVNIINK